MKLFTEGDMRSIISRLITTLNPQLALVSKSLFLITFGFTMIIVFGFASPELIHDADHDVRHIMTFPCH